VLKKRYFFNANNVTVMPYWILCKKKLFLCQETSVNVVVNMWRGNWGGILSPFMLANVFTVRSFDLSPGLGLLPSI
jgi:hypothetical protein